MTRRLLRIGVVLAMIVVAILLSVDTAYMVSGSLEQFPTAEQEEKVRVVSASIAALLLVAEVALWFIYRQLGDEAR